eukprot:symbB.v1.2.029368.t1/scaffold3207.1/size61170/4
MFLSRTFGIFFLVSLTACWGYCSSAGWILILLSYTTHAMIPYNKGGHPLSPDLFLIGMVTYQWPLKYKARVASIWQSYWAIFLAAVLLCSMPSVSGRCDLHPLNTVWERCRFRLVEVVLVTGLVTGAFHADDPHDVTPWMNLWSLYAYCFHVAWARMLPKPYGALLTYGSIPLFYASHAMRRRRRDQGDPRDEPPATPESQDEVAGLSSWGSNLLGQASEQLGPAAAAAAASIRSGVKEVKKSVKENLGTVASVGASSFTGQSHQLQGVNGTPARDVTEVAFLAEGAFGAVMKVSCNRTGETFALKKISCMEGVQVASSFDAAEREAKALVIWI